MKCKKENAKKQIKQFTVRESKWARGGKNGEAKLLNDDGNMCCLGFLGKACGVAKEYMDNVDMPDDLNYGNNNYPKLSKGRYWGFFAEKNDAPEISDTERKIELSKMFKELGIKIIFKL